MILRKAVERALGKLRKKWFWVCWVLLGLACVALPTMAFVPGTSMDEKGVDAIRVHNAPYNLQGRKVAIGQVEIGRPGIFSLDKIVAWNPPINLAQVFLQDKSPTANRNVDPHAFMVAGVMVSRDKAIPGVAPMADLYSSAVGSPRNNGQPEECLTSQHVALQNGGDVRAINFSFGEPLSRDPRPNATLDGNALLTQCIDWSARVHNVLYNIAGNQGGGGIAIPTDNYNGLNVAYSKRRNGVFAKIDFSNLSATPVGVGRTVVAREINVGPRRSINIAAPGHDVTVYNLRGKFENVSGTSFATPHVNATVAVLQEFGDRQTSSGVANWGVDSRRAEVMKSVILNSADKVQDQGDGNLLGMSRTVLAKDEKNWLESDAYSDPQIPLDFQMGTGHLNVYRAYQQFSPGQQPAGKAGMPIGWDYGKVEAGKFQEYPLEKPLTQGSFAAITLNWQRLVELQDKNNNGMYEVGETFSDRGLNNLDLYLMPIESNDPNQSTCASISPADSLEHIFCPVPKTGQYKIRVQYKDQANEPVQNYGLAWWTKG